ncbi:membrane protein implicated in regulation of membrane protease activity [Conyzicola lurida]|uniref:Membrane protein implicated in regulation of membrane protease activity n=1 Tax=Conyzicola lurida TaxID=1172621 RepID=A0A841AGP3_9MICO|nr:NfeD family protein [Conyzicola lurida]MBB5842990.1 membrane protein implicated in regulation of membrane protease activity [Conyzicola lurida]
MLIEFLMDYAWVVWVSLILIFLVIEVFTLDFTFLMLALGSVAGLASSFTPLNFWVQIVIAAVVAVALIFAVRPPLLRRLGRGADPTLSNVEALLGKPGTVATDFVAGNGYVKLSNGETWTARVVDHSTHPLATGDRVVVISIDGATAVVAPAERTAL